MNQNTRVLLTLAALAGLATAAGLFAWKGVAQADRRAAAVKAQAQQVAAPPPAADQPAPAGSVVVRSFTITAQGETTEVQRYGPTLPWHVARPFDAPADALVVDDVVSTLQQATFSVVLERNPDPATLAKYGLDHPSFVVEALLEDRGRPRVLLLEGGVENAFDGSIALRRGGDQAIYAARGGLRAALARSSYELRDKQILALDESSLRALSLKSALNDWQLERTDGVWSVTRPFKATVDPTQLTALLGVLKAERAQAFLAASPELFRRPVLELTAVTSYGETHLRFARPPVDAGESVLVERTGGPGDRAVALVSAAALQVDRNALDLKDKALVRFQKDQVASIVLRSPAGAVRLAKDGVDGSAESWRVIEPRPGKANILKVTGLLWQLSGLRATSWPKEKPNDLKQFPATEARFIELNGADGQPVARLQVGAHVPDTAPGTVYVRGTSGQLGQADGTRLSEFPWTVEDALAPSPGLDAGATSAGP